LGFAQKVLLEFLNKMPNLGILESRNLMWGGIHRSPVQFLKTVLNLSWHVFVMGWVVYWQHSKLIEFDPGSSLMNTLYTNNFNFLYLLKITLWIPSLKRSDVVRPENRFDKSNPGISTHTKCLWIPTLDAFAGWPMMKKSRKKAINQ
jgi:hypothetical protein